MQAFSSTKSRAFHRALDALVSCFRTRTTSTSSSPERPKVFWRSNDAGKTWSRTTGPEIIVNDVSIDSTDSHHVLIATDRGGVLSSHDGGDTFQSSNAGFSARQITAFKRDKDQPAVVLVGMVNDKEWGGVFRSSDGGLSWQQRSEGLQGRDVFSLGQAPDGTFIAGTAHGIFRYDGAALSWVKVDNAPAAATAPDGVHPPGVMVRAPVPVSRNHYANRSAPQSAPSHRASASHVAASQKHPSRDPLPVSLQLLISIRERKRQSPAPTGCLQRTQARSMILTAQL